MALHSEPQNFSNFAALSHRIWQHFRWKTLVSKNNKELYTHKKDVAQFAERLSTERQQQT